MLNVVHTVTLLLCQSKPLYYHFYLTLQTCCSTVQISVFFVMGVECIITHTHTRLTALFPGLPRWAGTRNCKTNLNFTEARDSEWQWHQLGCMQVCTSLQADNHASTPPLSFLQARCPSCRPSNSVKALKEIMHNH